jgi:hypothetical protein
MKTGFLLAAAQGILYIGGGGGRRGAENPRFWRAVHISHAGRSRRALRSRRSREPHFEPSGEAIDLQPS